MYYPYLRAKKHELHTILSIDSTVFSKVLPILEPVNLSAKPGYRRLAQEGRPVILIVNPAYGAVSPREVQVNLIEGELQYHPRLTLGFLVDQRYTPAWLDDFLQLYPEREKALIFRHTPKSHEILSITEKLQKSLGVQHLIFDEKKTSSAARNAFNWHSNRVLLTDGFQRQEKNADYGTSSDFSSLFTTSGYDGYAGFGDYLIVGDYYREGGGQAYVITLHLTVPEGRDLSVYHFSSDSDSHIQGLAPGKFLEACEKLANSPEGLALPRTTGMELYLDWYSRAHFPNLGLPKQASMQHHIEMVHKFMI